MASRGDVGLVFRTPRLLVARNYQTLTSPFVGMGPVTNTGLSASTVDGLIVLLNDHGARVDATRADGSGLWSFYDLSYGRYTAVDVVTNGQWFIDVAADLTFTVTENTGPAVTSSYAFA